MLALYVAIQTRLLMLTRRRGHECGQATAEYAIVLLGAAGVALFLMKWVAKTDLIGRLLDAVINLVLGKIL